MQSFSYSPTCFKPIICSSNQVYSLQSMISLLCHNRKVTTMKYWTNSKLQKHLYIKYTLLKYYACCAKDARTIIFQQFSCQFCQNVEFTFLSAEKFRLKPIFLFLEKVKTDFSDYEIDFIIQINNSKHIATSLFNLS